MWQQTISVTKNLAQQLIEDQTDLKVTKISFLGRGFDNIAYLVNNAYVFRFPTREVGITCMRNEFTLSNYIKKHVDFPFSYPQFIGKPTKQYPDFG